MGCRGAVRVAALLLAGAFPVVAPGVVDIAPFTSATLEHDDNVFRFADKEEALALRGSPAQADTFGKFVAGAFAEIAAGLQRLRFDGAVREFRYRRFTELDRVEHDVGSRLDWNVGVPWSGQLGYRQSRQLEPFTNRDTLQRGFLEQQRADLLASLELTPRWQAQMTLADWRKRYTSLASQRADLDEDRAGLALLYAGSPVGSVGVVVDWTRGSFPRRVASSDSGLASEYRQADYKVRVTYAPSGISTLKLEAGRTSHAGNSGTREFDGPTARMSFERRGGVARLAADVSRQLVGVEEADANFLERTVAEASVDYRITALLRGLVRATVRDDDYHGPASLVAGEGVRRDDTLALEAGLAWQISRVLSLTTTLRRERRESSRASRAYDTTAVGLTLEARFD